MSANTPALGLFTEGVAAHLLEPPINVYRLGLHPDGLASRVRNLAEYSQHLITQLRRDAALSGDPRLAALLDEVRGYPGVVDGGVELVDAASLLFLPIELEQSDGSVLSLFSTISTFGTALDVTLAELSIEQFFPADQATQDALLKT